MQYQAQRDYLDMVESGIDPHEALIEINRRNRNIAKAKEIKANLFAEESQYERQTSGRLTTTNVMQAIETEKRARKRRLRKIRLEALFLDEEPETRLMPNVVTEPGYHVVIEKNRPFSLKMTEPEYTTLSLMMTAAQRCRGLTGHWPTHINVNAKRFLVLDDQVYSMGYITVEDVQIPFVCADMADYDVEAVYDVMTKDDAWVNDRKAS